MKIFGIFCVCVIALAAGLVLPRVTSGKGESLSIVTLDRHALEVATFSVAKDEAFMASTAGPIQAAAVDSFTSQDKKLNVGMSAYKKVTLKLTNWPVDEVMFLLEGSVEITDSNGRGRVYKAGDAFVMPKGFSGTWRQLSDIKKVQIVYE